MKIENLAKRYGVPFILLIFLHSHSIASPTKLSGFDFEKIAVIQCLNQVVVSLTHIITYNDKVVLDQEYDNIINNLNLRSIPDEEIIFLLQGLMDLLTNSKIQDREREIIDKKYVKNVNNAIVKSIRSSISGIQFTANPYTTISSGLISAGSVYFNYRNEIDQYKEDRDNKDWEIEKNIMLNLNQFRMSLLRASWRLLNSYDIPDEWRLAEKQLEEYTETLKENDVELRYRRLKRMEKYFSMYPPFYYYLGKNAQDLGRYDEALTSYDRFIQNHANILRKDQFVSSVRMNRLILSKNNRAIDDIRRDLDIIIENSENSDWVNILFVALQHARFGNMEMARELILRNADNGYPVNLGTYETIDVLASALLFDSNPDEFNSIVDAILKNDTVKNYEVLKLYGKMRNKDVLNKLQPEFENIGLAAKDDNKPWYKLGSKQKDGLTLYLPGRWVADNFDIAMRFSIVDGNEFLIRNYSIEKVHENLNLVLINFKDLFSIEEFIKNENEAIVSIGLNRDKLFRDRNTKSKYDVELRFKSRAITEQDLKNLEKLSNFWYLASIPGVIVKNYSENKKKERVAIIFDKIEVVFNGEIFVWNENGINPKQR